MATYKLENLDCAVCAADIESALASCPFVRKASVDFATASLAIETDDLHAAAKVIEKTDPSVRLVLDSPTSSVTPPGGGASAAPRRARLVEFGSYALPLRRVVLFALSALLWVLGVLVQGPLSVARLSWLPLIPFAVAYVLSGAPVLKSALRDLRRGKPMDENFLMTIATVGAFAVGAWEEAAGVMLFYMIGELAQEAAVSRSRRSVEALLDLRSDTARVKVGGAWTAVPADRVAVGSTLLVLPGERIPLDGVVLEGSGAVDESMLTGESAPVYVAPGSTLRAGTSSLDGALVLRSERVAGDSAAARIVALVEGAMHAKAKSERFISSFARVYTPIVVVLAVLIAVVPPLLTGGPSWGLWLYRALVLLVISCPCALVLSVPLGYFAGIGGLSRRGVLVKGSAYLDTLAAARRVVFDKTGTLSTGEYRLSGVEPASGWEASELLDIAAAAESRSNHPVARAVVAGASAAGAELSEPVEARERPGLGMTAVVGGRSVVVGTRRLLSELGVPEDEIPVGEGGGAVLVAVDGRYAGLLRVGDAIREGASRTMRELRRLGIEEVAILSGDSEEEVRRVTEELGADRHWSRLLPADKLGILESLMKTGGPTVFVGDGINDAPVIARADVGIAMGSGADVSVEAADAVVMTDDPRRVSEAIAQARRVRRIVRQNVVFALSAKVFFLALGAAGVATMWEAVIADVGVALIAVLNSTRALR